MKMTLGEMSMARKLAFLGVGALFVAGMISLLLCINQPEYQVLFSGLNQRDDSQVETKTKDPKGPYHLKGDGTTIRVPSENLYEARLTLAGEGIPRGSGIGFEVFK